MYGQTVGELCQTLQYKTTVEWTIKDIFSYTKENECCQSPSFSLPGSLWRLCMHPNGQDIEENLGWISVFLERLDKSAIPKHVDFTCSIVNSVSIEEDASDDDIVVFDLESTSWGWSQFFRRTELLERKDALAPSGDLTLTCTMKLKEGLESISRFNKLSEDLGNMFISKRGCDATLKVQDKNFAVHRSILIARSPVLGAMFEVDMEEKKTGQVNIVDCHPEAFEDFLTYIYSGKFILSSHDVYQLYRIAHKYQVEQLKSDCAAYMIYNLSVDTLFDAALIGHEFDDNEIKPRIQNYFVKEFKKIAPTAKWESVLKDNPSLAFELLKNMAAEM